MQCPQQPTHHRPTNHHPPERPDAPDPPRPRRGFDSPEDFNRRVEPHLLRIWVAGWLPDEPTGALVKLVQASSLHQQRCASRRRRHELLSEPRGKVCCEEDPLAFLEQNERAAAVRAAVQAMPLDFRRVLEEFEFDGASYQEIAAELALPLGTVRSRLSRARGLVRKQLLRGGRALGPGPPISWHSVRWRQLLAAELHGLYQALGLVDTGHREACDVRAFED